MALSDTSIRSKSEPGSDSNEGVLRTPQSFSITWDSSSDFLVSYPVHIGVGRGLNPSAEM